MSLSDVSDLTELSTDEDDVPLAKHTSKVKQGSKEYKITHVLRAPRTVQYTTKSLYDQIIDNSIDLDPEYQRDVVWQEDKQSGLIDSILRNYYIPPIIFAVTVQDDGSELRTCIDGKQRLTSIQRFIDGQIPHKDSFTNERLWFKSSATNAKRKLLSQHLRAQFVNKQIVCVEYTELNEDQEREIFQRVQLGVALTPAERLQALVGPWSTTIHEIQNVVLGEGGFEGYLNWGHARGRDFQCLATIGYLIENHPKAVIPGAKTLEKWLQKSQVVSNQLRVDMHETFRIFVTLAREKKYSGSLNQPTRVSPIEFVMIGLLIYLKRWALSLTQISSAIEKMRKDVRASHQDIRSNTRVTKHLMEFVAKIDASELKSDGEGDKPAALTIAKETKSTKRKRPAHSDDSDTEPPSKVKPAKSLSVPMPAIAVESPKETSDTSDQKANGAKKVAAVPNSKPSLMAKPSQSSTSRRTTNNSLSNLSPLPANNLSFPTSATQTSHDRTLPPSLSASNSDNAHSGSTILKTTYHTPLTIQTGSTVKAESPQMGLLSSPATLCAVDRLAPIRAAKASLTSGTSVQSPVIKDNKIGTMSKPGVNPHQTLLGLQQGPVISQPTVSQQQPLPSPSAQSLSQSLFGNPDQEDFIPIQAKGVLQGLHLQFLQPGAPAQGINNNTLHLAAVRQNVQSNGMNGHSMLPFSMPRPVNAGRINNSRHISQETSNGRITSAQQIPNQAPRLHLPPPWSPSSLSMSGNVVPQPPPLLPTMNFSTSTSSGLRALPQRPVAVTRVPSDSMLAERLGSPPGSVSLASTDPDVQRGPYNSDRYHSSDNGRPNRREYNQNFYHDKQNWYHSQP